MISQRTAKKIKEEFGYDFTKMSWKEISIHKGLCETFIEKYTNKINWYYISIYQKLSENFIEKHADEVCQSLQGFSYLLTLSLQSRYFSMLIHHFAGQIHFSLYHPIHTYAKMPFSPVFMLCAADFTKYTSIMFSMSINLTIILYIMQVLLATV